MRIEECIQQTEIKNGTLPGIGKRNGDNGGIPPYKLKKWGNFEVNGGFSICGTVVIGVLVGGRDKFENVRGDYISDWESMSISSLAAPRSECIIMKKCSQPQLGAEGWVYHIL